LFQTSRVSVTLFRMSTESFRADEGRRNQIQEASLIARAARIEESERRLTELATRLDDREDRMLDRHTQVMTRIFTGISIVVGGTVLAVTIMSIFSKSEVSDEVRAMRQEVNHETERSELKFERMKADFQQQFAAFAAESLKKPNIEIRVQTNLLNNETLHWSRNKPPVLVPLFIKNVGQKPTDPITLYVFSSAPLSYTTEIGEWYQQTSNDPEFGYKYRYLRPGATFGLAPGDTWPVPDSPIDYPGFSWDSSSNSMSCKLVVFYGGESPAEARFQVIKDP
jgi:hypothetical protein